MTGPCYCGKETFYLWADIDKALRNHRRRLHRNFMRAYWCEYAKGWHMTGTPNEKKRGKR